jgi:ribosome-associated protein
MPSQSQVLNIETQQRFLELYSSRLTRDGELILVSQKFRSQAQNAKDCLQKLKLMVAQALLKPKIRKATRPTLGSKKRRLKEKTNRSEVKQNRRAIQRED